MNATVVVDLQLICDTDNVPDKELMEMWAMKVSQVLQLADANYEVTIRIVDNKEIQQLNRDYRGKDKVTNVLSFPFELPQGITEDSDTELLGDIVICPQVVISEAAEQQKLLISHWAHMIIHGLLHLLGYDHIDESEADEMESIEIMVLSQLGYANPYLLNN